MEAILDDKIQEVVNNKYPSTPTWGEIFAKSELQQAINLEVLNVRASGWAMGRTDKEILDKAVKNLRARGAL
jgi:hypothetical protein